jgi:hypothetical protein
LEDNADLVKQRHDRLLDGIVSDYIKYKKGIIELFKLWTGLLAIQERLLNSFSYTVKQVELVKETVFDTSWNELLTVKYRWTSSVYCSNFYGCGECSFLFM